MPLVSLAILSFSKNLFINKSIINLNFLRICFQRKWNSCLSRLYYKKCWNGFFKSHCCLCERLRSRGYPIGNDKSSWWQRVSKCIDLSTISKDKYTVSFVFVLINKISDMIVFGSICIKKCLIHVLGLLVRYK